jgi:hypothetical protein
MLLLEINRIHYFLGISFQIHQERPIIQSIQGTTLLEELAAAAAAAVVVVLVL